MTPTKDKLVQDVAAQAGLVLRNVRLIEELRESRRRIVTAQDERARRLERDIHDGAQQQLVALGVKMRLMGAMLEGDPGNPNIGTARRDKSPRPGRSRPNGRPSPALYWANRAVNHIVAGWNP